MNYRQHFPLIAPSPNADDTQSRLHLQMSAWPQMSEIPKEERVLYRYQQEDIRKQQAKINSAHDDAVDELMKSTPTAGANKPTGLSKLADNSEQTGAPAPSLVTPERAKGKNCRQRNVST